MGVAPVSAGGDGGALFGITTDGVRLYYTGYDLVTYWGVFTPLYDDSTGQVNGSYTGLLGYVAAVNFDGGGGEILATSGTTGNFGPAGLVVVGTTLYVTDPNGGGSTQNVIWSLSDDGGPVADFNDSFGSNGNPSNIPSNATGMAFDPDAGLLFAADAYGGPIYSFNLSGEYVAQVTQPLWDCQGYNDMSWVNVAAANGAVYLTNSGQTGVSIPGVFVHQLSDATASYTPLIAGPPLQDVEGIVYNPDDGRLYFTDSGKYIYSIPAVGGPLSDPITNPNFIALRGITYFAGTLYVVDGQNLDDATDLPGVIWSVQLVTTDAGP